MLVRYALVAGPILMPLGFFLSVAARQAENPNRLIYLVRLGGLSLSVGAVTLDSGSSAHERATKTLTDCV